MRGITAAIDDVDAPAIRRCGQHPRSKTIRALRPPTVQKFKARAILVEQQVVKPVLGLAHTAIHRLEIGDLCERNHKFPPAWGRTKKEAELKAALNALSAINGDPTPYPSN